MEKVFLFIFLFFSLNSNSQNNGPEISPVRGIDTVDLYRIMDLLDVDVSRYLVSSQYKAYYCNFIIHEYREGKCVDSVSLRDSIRSYQDVLLIGNKLENGKFEVGVYSQRLGDSSLKIYALVGGLGSKMKRKLDKQRFYSWKEVYNLPNPKHPLLPGTLFPLLAYTSPVGAKYAANPNASEFCKISGEFIPYSRWYQDLGIEHYYIFFIRLEK